jgi:hypothetical protein
VNRFLLQQFKLSCRALPLCVTRFVWKDENVCCQDAAHYHATESHIHVTSRSCAGSLQYCHFCCLSSEPALSMSPVTVWHVLGLTTSTKSCNFLIINPDLVRSVFCALDNYPGHDLSRPTDELMSPKNTALYLTERPVGTLL